MDSAKSVSNSDEIHKVTSIKNAGLSNTNDQNNCKPSNSTYKEADPEQSNEFESHVTYSADNGSINEENNELQEDDYSDSDVEISVGPANSIAVLESLKSEQEKLELMLQRAEKQLIIELKKQEKSVITAAVSGNNTQQANDLKRRFTENISYNESVGDCTPVLKSEQDSEDKARENVKLNITCISKEEFKGDKSLPDGKHFANNDSTLNQYHTPIHPRALTYTQRKDHEVPSQEEDAGEISEGEKQKEALKIANISKIPKLRYDKVTIPNKTRMRCMYEICSSYNIMPLLTITYDINDWLNQLHLFLSLMGFPQFVKNTLENMNKEASFTNLFSEEAEYLVTLVLKKSILIEELRMQSSLIGASEQLANIITHVTENKDNQLNCSLYLWPGLYSCVSDSADSEWSLNVLIERYISLWKFDEPHILEFKSEFYEWYISLNYILTVLGMPSLLKPIIHMRNHKVPLQPLIDSSAEYIVRNYCLRTVRVTKLDSDWCGEKMIYKVISDCGFMESTLQVRSKMASLMIKNDDFSRLREDYYSAMMHAKFLGLTFEPQKIFGIILKRSAKKYQHYSTSFLESHPNLTLDDFIDYLESINDLAVETGAQFEPLPVRPPRKRGIKRKVSFKGNPLKKTK